MAESFVNDGFEQRLERALREYANEAVRPFDAVEITGNAAQRAGRGLFAWPSFPRQWRLALALVLLIVALAGVAIVGGFIHLPNNSIVPNPSSQPSAPASSAPTVSPTPGGPSESPIVIVVPPTTGLPGLSPVPSIWITGPTPSPAPTASATAEPTPQPTETAAPTSSPTSTPTPPPTPAPSPTIAPVGSVVAVALGDTHACALADDGRIFCWGTNDQGQLGDGTLNYRDYPTTPVVGIDDARAIAAGIRFSCAVRSDGSVWCWGEDPGNGPSTAVPVQVPNIDDATSVAAGGDFACALRSGGAVACWGVGDLGELGNGTFESNIGAADPQAVVGIDDAIQIASGWNHTCALRSVHSLWCWGGNGDGATGYGQLGNGTLDNSSIPVEVTGLDNVSAVAAGGWSTCATRTDGTAWCWGYGEKGGLGDGNATNSSTPVQVAGISDARLLTVGDYHACVTEADDSSWCWGDTSWGSATGGPADTPVEGNRSADAVPQELATGGEQNLTFLDQRGRVWVWGFGTNQSPDLWPVGP